MKFVLGLLILITGSYYGIDHLLASYFGSHSNSLTTPEQATVQGMAQFLDSNPLIQRKIAEVNQPANPPPQSAEGIKESPANAYLGNSPTDQFFKKMMNLRSVTDENNIDASLQQTIEILDYIKENPKESIDTLERALESMPKELEKERASLSSAYIHASINFIENSSGDRNEKLNYIKRFSDRTGDPEIKNAIESHFSSFLEEENDPKPERQTNSEPASSEQEEP